MSSKQPRKQRKALYTAPLHKKQKFVSAKLSDELQEEFGKRSLTVRKGDVVRLLRGDNTGHEGKVEGVELKSGLLKVEGVTVANYQGKLKRHGQTSGRRASWKKAYVKLAEGSSIDFLGGE